MVVDPRGYRVRLLGGSNDRYYHLWLEASCPLTAAGAANSKQGLTQ